MELRVDKLNISIAGRQIIRDLSFSCHSGQSVALVGASGCGKTTLLNTLSGLLRPSSGSIFYDGDDIAQWPERKIRRFWATSAGFVLQDAGMDEEANVAYNVSFQDSVLFNRRPVPEVIEVLRQVGLEDRADSPVMQLSGGEQRRVAIARLLFRKVKVVFADEPTASLDQNNRDRIQELLLGLAHNNKLVIIATHDLELANACTEVVEL